MTNEYEALCRIRDEECDGIKPWHWITEDNGGWDGPKGDWETSHKPKILKHVGKRDCCISAGGNQGLYPRILGELFAYVYTFEPDPLNFYCLVRNCQMDNIIKIQAALGETNEMCRVIRKPMENTGMHTIELQRKEDCHIPVLTIDSFHFQNLDLIHLDLEGHELPALKGAIRNIQQHRPLIMAERGQNDAFKQFMSQYGYKNIDHSISDTIYKYGA